MVNCFLDLSGARNIARNCVLRRSAASCGHWTDPALALELGVKVSDVLSLTRIKSVSVQMADLYLRLQDHPNKVQKLVNIHLMLINSPDCSTCLFSWYGLQSTVDGVSDVTKHRTARCANRRARLGTGRFAPSSVLPLHLFNDSCLFSCLFS